MSDAHDNRFRDIAEDVIRELRGDPNKHLSKPGEKRWGNGGSLSLDTKTGRIYDHEQGQGGGLVWFVQEELGLAAPRDAFNWLAERGHVRDEGRRDQPAEKKQVGPYRERPPHPRSPQAQTPPQRDQGPPPGDPGPMPPDDRFGPPPGDPGDPGPQPDDRGMPPPRSAPRTDPAGNWIPKNLPDTAVLAKTYDYQTLDGEVAYQVCRYEWPDPETEKGRGKHFLQRIPDPKKPNGYSYKTKGMEWLPYRLPELAADVDEGRVIFIVEGEKKVDMLRDIGVPATCNHGGAGKFPVELTRHFHGAKVCILPDNDKAGRDHATLVGRRLRKIAEAVLILDLPGLPPKGGVDDWLPAGGTSEQLYRLMRDEARPFVPPPPETKFGGVAWADLDAPGKQLEFVIKGVLAANELSMLVGESQSGKSFLALDLAMSIARGRDFFGHKTRQGGVIYQAGESATGLRRRRIPAYRQHHEVNDPTLPFVLLENQIDLFGNPEQIDALVQECLAWRDTFDVPLDLIVIDTFNRATPGANENDGRDMSIVLENAEKIRRETGAAVMMVHHMNAGGTKARGHTSLYANVDTVIMVRKVEDAKDPSGRQVREWTISKQKDGEDGVKHSFVLPAIEIGRDADGDRLTSCIIAQPRETDGGADQGAEPGAQVSGWTETALRAIYNAINEHGEAAPQSLGMPHGAMVVNRRAVARELARVAPADGLDGDDIRRGETQEQAEKRRRDARQKKAADARDRLYSRGVIRMDDNWIWLTGKRVRGFPPPPGARGWADTGRDEGGDQPGVDLPFDMEDFA